VVIVVLYCVPPGELTTFVEVIVLTTVEVEATVVVDLMCDQPRLKLLLPQMQYQLTCRRMRSVH
jgi:hypothetical protein